MSGVDSTFKSEAREVRRLEVITSALVEGLDWKRVHSRRVLRPQVAQ